MFLLYCLPCLISGKMYVGITSRLLAVRWGEHVSKAVTGHIPIYRLQRAILKYGPENFEVTELFRYATRAEAQEAEISLVASLDLVRKGYNASPGGSMPVFSAETRAKMSAAKKGRLLSPEHCAKLSAARLGKKRGPMSDETKAKLSASKKGRKLSPDHAKKVAAAVRGRKMPPRTDEHRAALSASIRGRTLSPAWREKISDSLRRRVITPETRAKISAHRKAHWARLRRQAEDEALSVYS